MKHHTPVLCINSFVFNNLMVQSNFNLILVNLQLIQAELMEETVLSGSSLK